MKHKDLRLLLSLGSSRKLLVGSILAAIITTSIVITNAHLIGKLIAGIITGRDLVGLWLLQLIALFIFRAFFLSYFESWSSTQATVAKAELRNSITNSLADLEKFSPSELTQVLIKGINSLDIYLGRFIPQLVQAIVMPFTVIISIALLDPLSAVIAIFTIPLIPLFGALIGKFTDDAVRRKWNSLGVLARYFEDSVRGYVTLRIFGREKSQSHRIQDMGGQFTRETMKVLRISFLSALVLEIAATISVALIAVSIGLRMIDSHLAFVTGLTVLILAPEVYLPLRNSASLFHASADGSEVLEKVAALEQSKPAMILQIKRDFANCNSLAWQDWELKLDENFHSRLPGAGIHKGETMLIHGPSGIGKSTFAKFLLGARASNSILIDNQPLRPEEIDSYQQQIAWIPQLPFLAPGNIRDQFILVNKKITDPEILDALAEVSLDLRDMPAGLDTPVGSGAEKSGSLSGGQLRKIAVARALLRRSLVIIADEPTADLDAESSAIVMRALRARKDSALICITHDEEIAQIGDHILSFEQVAS
jgi:ABC-type transport system involved in cytochrome bd biosynthesis fused ATPase/permease subunit